jgi:gamma-glutamyltranspeptidase / glutathione hydrolase
MTFSMSPTRMASVASEAMVAASQPAATLSGLDVLREGGNAVDAALCAAAVLCVTEPHSTGIGGDLFAIVRDPAGRLHGLDAAGPAPRLAPAEPPAYDGPRSVDVPGAVAGWAELSRRFGRFGLDRCLEPAIELARIGVAAGFNSSRSWRLTPSAPPALGPPPGFGQRFCLPDLAATLDGIAAYGPKFFYAGPPAEEIAAASWLSLEDLAEYAPRWVEPLVRTYRGVEIAELPPPTQGVAVLEALAILGDDEPSLSDQVRAVALALEDALREVRDGAAVSHLLEPEHVAARRASMPGRVAEPAGGTVVVCAVDRDGMAVSLLQSLYESFGSGVVAGTSGVVLNNRAAGFAVQGTVVGGTRPYHTLIPGMLTRPRGTDPARPLAGDPTRARADDATPPAGGELIGPFALMGGFIQAQSHVQFLASLMSGGDGPAVPGDPQVALDRGRFRVDGASLSLEEPLWARAGELAGLGLRIRTDTDRGAFGGGQAIIARDGTLFGGSDARKDGCALGI